MFNVSVNCFTIYIYIGYGGGGPTQDIFLKLLKIILSHFKNISWVAPPPPPKKKNVKPTYSVKVY